jgi:ADP-dependent NAD(P)H-hydrate dehydratase / NAD(P)H-hydrate epimerase
MAKILRVADVRRIEDHVDQHGLALAHLMQLAGKSVAEVAASAIRSRRGTSVLILVGPGNNGGDGLVAGHELAKRHGLSVRCYLAAPNPLLPLLTKGIDNEDAVYLNAQDDADRNWLKHWIETSSVIIDAVLGIGTQLPLRGSVKALLQFVQSVIADLPAQERPFLISVDTPSGLDADTGEYADETLSADITVTFIGVKPGLIALPAADRVGTLRVYPLDTERFVTDLAPSAVQFLERSDIAPLLPKRAASGHKGSFGHVLVIGGSERYTGAPGLTALGALRSGAGSVSVATRRAVIDRLAASILEAIWQPLALSGDSEAIQSDMRSLEDLLGSASAIVVGPGMGSFPGIESWIFALLALCHKQGIPTVLDADALNAIGSTGRWWEYLPTRSVITPHPGEMARLTGLSVGAIQRDRLSIAAQYSALWGTTLVLKGAFTVISTPGHTQAVVPFSTSALAKAGTGDVLAGVIAALLAQGMEPHAAATAGAFLHGWVGKHYEETVSGFSLLAHEVADGLAEAFNDLLANPARRRHESGGSWRLSDHDLGSLPPDHV